MYSSPGHAHRHRLPRRDRGRRCACWRSAGRSAATRLLARHRSAQRGSRRWSRSGRRGCTSRTSAGASSRSHQRARAAARRRRSVSQPRGRSAGRRSCVQQRRGWNAPSTARVVDLAVRRAGSLRQRQRVGHHHDARRCTAAARRARRPQTSKLERGRLQRRARRLVRARARLRRTQSCTTLRCSTITPLGCRWSRRCRSRRPGAAASTRAGVVGALRRRLRPRRCVELTSAAAGAWRERSGSAPLRQQHHRRRCRASMYCRRSPDRPDRAAHRRRRPSAIPSSATTISTLRSTQIATRSSGPTPRRLQVMRQLVGPRVQLGVAEAPLVDDHAPIASGCVAACSSNSSWMQRARADTRAASRSTRPAAAGAPLPAGRRGRAAASAARAPALAPAAPAPCCMKSQTRSASTHAVAPAPSARSPRPGRRPTASADSWCALVAETFDAVHACRPAWQCGASALWR